MRLLTSIAIAFATLVTAAPAQNDVRGRDFQIAFMPTNGYDELPTFTLWISSSVPTLCTLSYAEVSDRNRTIQLPGGDRAVRVTLDTFLLLLPSARLQPISRRTLRVSSRDELIIRGINGMRWSSDAFLALPVSRLDREYMIVAWPNTQQPNPLGEIPGVSDFSSQFTVVAAENDTRVTIVPTARINNNPDRAPFEIMLNRGEAFLAQAEGPTGTDLTGTTVSATRPVAVFSGHERANIPFSKATGRDHLVEQLLPLSLWRTRMVTVPHAPINRSTADDGIDVVRFVASEDDTQLEVSGRSIERMRRGEYFDIPLDSARMVVASKPVLAMQYMHSCPKEPLAEGDSLGDPFMTTIVPIELFDTAYTVVAMGSKDISVHYVDVTISERALASLRLDGMTVGSPTLEVLGSSYRYVHIRIDSGSHRLAADEPFGATVYGYGPYNSYAYPAGMVFTPIPLGVDVETTAVRRLLAVRPNPVVGESIIELEVAAPRAAELQISDTRGRVRLRRSIEAGVRGVAIDAHELGDGVYVARILSSDEVIASTAFTVLAAGR